MVELYQVEHAGSRPPEASAPVCGSGPARANNYTRWYNRQNDSSLSTRAVDRRGFGPQDVKNRAAAEALDESDLLAI